MSQFGPWYSNFGTIRARFLTLYILLFPKLLYSSWLNTMIFVYNGKLCMWTYFRSQVDIQKCCVLFLKGVISTNFNVHLHCNRLSHYSTLLHCNWIFIWLCNQKIMWVKYFTGPEVNKQSQTFDLVLWKSTRLFEPVGITSMLNDSPNSSCFEAQDFCTKVTRDSTTRNYGII